MKNIITPIAALAMAMGLVSAQAPDSSLSFFITSIGLGKGANLGGLAGADAHCLQLASQAGATHKDWKAYLSTQASGNSPAIHARDRIGTGPWFNARKVMVAASVADLHSANNKLNKVNSRTEKGDTVKGRGDSPNQHDILTGSKLDGTAFGSSADSTCANWTSETTGGAQLGHHDRQGGGANPESWNSAHRSNGCTQANLVATGGAGYFYCFAADAGGATVGLRAMPMKSQPIHLGSISIDGQGAEGGGRAYRYRLLESADIEIQIITAKGEKVMTLAKGKKPAGHHEVAWNGRNANGNLLPPGIYLLKLMAH